MIKKCNQVLGIRVDGGGKIGYGHIVRCKALADILNKKDGCEILFFCKHLDTNSYARISNYKIVKLDSSIIEEDIRKIKSYDIDFLIIDVMEFDKKKAEQFNTNFKCINIGGSGNGRIFSYVCIDGIVYKKCECKQRALYFKGPEYIIIRNSISKLRSICRYVRHNINNILLIFGGTDIKDFTYKIIDILLEIGVVGNVTAVIGNSCKKLSLRSSNKVSILNNPKDEDIAKAMAACDVAIVNGGMVAYELIALGKPVIIYPVTYLQSRTARYLDRIDISICGGSEVSKQFVVDSLSKLTYSRRKLISQQSKKIIDGKGLIRIANIINKVTKVRN
jgi:UDP-2,4-diacetamido-2,4,6-trideoxy-beta-L-altropyranose hydrolase